MEIVSNFLIPSILGVLVLGWILMICLTNQLSVKSNIARSIIKPKKLPDQFRLLYLSRTIINRLGKKNQKVQLIENYQDLVAKKNDSGQPGVKAW